MPGGKNRSHFPHYHSDLTLGHPFEMINIWFPLTILNKKDSTFAPCEKEEIPLYSKIS